MSLNKYFTGHYIGQWVYNKQFQKHSIGQRDYMP